MEHLDLEYILYSRRQHYAYIPMPYLLITHSAYRDLEAGAKILYTLLLNRVSLSKKNSESFSDKEGRLYVIYTVQNVMDDMGVAKATAVKYLDNLSKKGLIKRVKQGQGKPAITYVKDFASVRLDPDTERKKTRSSQKFKNYTSRSLENRLQEVQKIDRSKQDNNHLDNSHPPQRYGKHQNILLNEREYIALQADYEDKLPKVLDECSDKIFGRGFGAEEIKYPFSYVQTVAKSLGYRTKAEIEREEAEKLERKHKAIYDKCHTEALLGMEPSEDDAAYLSDEELEELQTIAISKHEEWLKEREANMQEISNRLKEIF